MITSQSSDPWRYIVWTLGSISYFILNDRSKVQWTTVCWLAFTCTGWKSRSENASLFQLFFAHSSFHSLPDLEPLPQEGLLGWEPSLINKWYIFISLRCRRNRRTLHCGNPSCHWPKYLGGVAANKQLTAASPPDDSYSGVLAQRREHEKISLFLENVIIAQPQTSTLVAADGFLWNG